MEEKIIMLEEIKENETVKWAVNKFLKYGLGLFLVIGIVLILQKTVGFWFDIKAGLGF